MTYETALNENESSNCLLTAGWRYQLPSSKGDRFSDWIVDLGYGVGTAGSGWQASVTTSKILGLNLTAKYEDVSLINDESSFTVQISSSTFVSPSRSFGNSRFERLRKEGGLAILPFLDANGNNQRDAGEVAFTEGINSNNAEFLFLINDQEVSRFSSYSADLRSNGIFVRLLPGVYRFDVDPAGIPLGFRSDRAAYAVEVKAGSYTAIPLPLTPAYILLGQVLDDSGEPVEGARVEAIASQTDKTILSVTNGAGIYYLENLGLGEYELQINGQLAQPGQILIEANSETFTELNLVNGTSSREE